MSSQSSLLAPWGETVRSLLMVISIMLTIRSGDIEDYYDNADDDDDDNADDNADDDNDDDDGEVRWAQWRFCLQEASTTRPDQGRAPGGGG